MRPAPSRADRVHAGLLILLAALILIYWAAYFATDLTKPDFTRDPAAATLTAVYLGFENAFPLADGFVALTAAAAARGLLRGDPGAGFYGLLSAGGLAFLALIDIGFNLEHGFYRPQFLRADPGMALEAAINFACLAFAAYSALWFRRRRPAGGPFGQ